MCSAFLFDANQLRRGLTQMAPVALLLLLLSVTTASANNVTSYEGYKVYRLNYTDNHQFQLVHTALMHDDEVDFWRKNDIMVSVMRQESFEQQLKEMGVEWKVLIDNVQTLIDEEKGRMKVRSRSESRRKFHSHREMRKYLHRLATQYPNTTSVDSIGSSSEGRDLSILKISSGGNHHTLL